MDFAMLFQLLILIARAATKMEALETGKEVETLKEALPGVVVTWRDGRQFVVGLEILRTR